MYIKGWNNPCNLSMLPGFVCYRRIIWNLHIYIITMKKETKRTCFKSSSNKFYGGQNNDYLNHFYHRKDDHVKNKHK